MKLMQEAVTDTRRIVYGSLPEQINLLAQPYPTGGDRLTFELDIEGIQPGMILASGLNEWFVKEVDAPSKTVFVVSQWNGSFNERLPEGAVVMMRPRATDWFLMQEVNRAIVSMSSRTRGLYVPRVAICPASDSFANWGVFTFAADDVVSIATIRMKEPWGGSGGWHTLQDRDWRWHPDRAEIKILSRDYGWVREIEVLYRGKFKPAGTLIDDLETVCGLQPSMTDIPSLGAASALLLTTESRRVQISAQGDPRRASEVPPMSNTSASREMRKQFENRCDDEYANLLNVIPLRMSV